MSADPTHSLCPATGNKYTHHLKPAYIGKNVYVLACEYCKKTDKEIRETNV